MKLCIGSQQIEEFPPEIAPHEQGKRGGCALGQHWIRREHERHVGRDGDAKREQYPGRVEHGPHFRIQTLQGWPHRQGKRKATFVIVLHAGPVVEKCQAISRCAALFAITSIGAHQV